MRIIFATDSFLPTHNGVVSSVINYAEGLAELGHSILIFFPQHPQLDLSNISHHRNIELYGQPSFSLGLYPGFRAVYPTIGMVRKFDEFKPDIIHVHTPFFAGWISKFYAKLKKIPIVGTYNTLLNHKDAFLFLNVPKPLMKWIQECANTLFYRFFRSLDLVLAISRASAEELMEKHIYSEIVYLPIPLNGLITGKEEGKSLKKKMGIPLSLIYVGRLSKEKNVVKALELLSKLRQKLPQLGLVLIGDGPERSNLERKAKELDIVSNVHFLGSFSYHDVIKQGVFYLGDVFITLSEFEAQGMSTVEAMACGLPVIAADASASAEIVKNVGVLVDNKDLKKSIPTIIRLLSDNKTYQKYSQASLQRSADFSIEICSGKLEKVYQKLLSDSL